MNSRVLRIATGFFALALCIGPAVTASAANATKWVGAQAATYSGANIFNVSESAGGVVTITVTQGAGATYLSGLGSNSGQLVGIDGLWIVGTSGKSVSGATAKSSTVTGSLKSTKSWTAESNPAGFGGVNGYGLSSSSDWIALASSSTLSSYGKTSDGYTSGVFTFDFGTSAPPLSDLAFGIDYLTGSNKSTNTGRAYFDTQPLLPKPVPAVPEPATVLPFVLTGVLVAAAAARRAQKSSAKLSPADAL